MNTAVVNRRRSLPTFKLLLAAGAAVLAVITTVGADAGSAAPAATIFGPAHPLGADHQGIPCDEHV